jgi:purine-binding chemotaxis protein CheW
MTGGQVVIFELAGVRYGIDILQVQEIIRMVEITPVAEADVYVDGIINLRGQVIPVVNLGRRLGLPEKEKDQDSRVVVVEYSGKKIGFLVDRVLEVGTYSHEEMEDPSDIGADMCFLKGIIKKKENLWLVLNLSEVS